MSASPFTVVFICFILACRAGAQDLDISLPLNRSVYQQNAEGQSDIPFAVQFLNPAIKKVIYKVERLHHQTGNLDHPVLIHQMSVPTDGLYQTTLQLNRGWYMITVKTYNTADELLSEQTVKTGVGEVFFSAGQSNIQGVELGTSGPPLLEGSAYDGISAVNQNCFCKKTFPFPVFEKLERGNDDTQKKIAPNGNQNVWCYEVIGRLIADRDGGTPAVFFNTASTGTTVVNWSESAGNENLETYSPWGVANCSTEIEQWASEGPEGHPYRSLKTALNYYGGMFGARVVLWHQGESDNFIGTSESDYTAHLNNVIAHTRQHFHPQLGWSVSRVSHFPPHTHTSPIRSAQEASKNQNMYTTWGAYYSDDLTEANGHRGSDNLHFNQQGLIALGEQFANGTTTPYPLPDGHTDVLSLPPVSASSVPDIAVTAHAEGYTLSTTGSFRSYCWVKDNGPINHCEHTSASINVTTGKWRCYVTPQTSNPRQMNLVLTRNVQLPLTHYQPSLSLRPASAPAY